MKRAAKFNKYLQNLFKIAPLYCTIQEKLDAK